MIKYDHVHRDQTKLVAYTHLLTLIDHQYALSIFISKEYIASFTVIIRLMTYRFRWCSCYEKNLL